MTAPTVDQNGLLGSQSTASLPNSFWDRTPTSDNPARTYSCVARPQTAFHPMSGPARPARPHRPCCDAVSAGRKIKAVVAIVVGFDNIGRRQHEDDRAHLRMDIAKDAVRCRRGEAAVLCCSSP